MGLFDRKSAKVQGTSARNYLPPSFAADLTAASQIMDRWDAAMATDQVDIASALKAANSVAAS